ncbi:unnamed protein product [Clonostachys rosea f. rosea IK726]|uniref:Phosphatidylinositol-specific phospholipase C X domain-containing protein n=2 Tax=Bionectria ochroleuca TaxID=29856 RepID=A0A0B7JUC6_BIOOC|nr:unnamed protein product [Clonostachys rosea f. rosea IK726]
MMMLLLYGLVALAAGVCAQSTCNGYAALCDRKYSSITFAAAHNAAFVGRGPFHNQYQYPEVAMSSGIRYFTTQVHIQDGQIRQCHTDCAFLNVGAFSEIVTSIKTWLDANPREVVTLLIGNGDDAIQIEEFKPHFEASGAQDIAFVPGTKLGLDDWPTLGEMIDSGKRLVVFMDYYSDTSKVPYILPQFDYYVETPFSPTDDNFFNCDVDRPSKDTPAAGRMVFANHNLNEEIAGILIPDQLRASQTNSQGNIRQQTEICVSNYGRNPNVVLLDFVSEGEVIAAQKTLNGL